MVKHEARRYARARIDVAIASLRAGRSWPKQRGSAAASGSEPQRARTWGSTSSLYGAARQTFPWSSATGPWTRRPGVMRNHFSPSIVLIIARPRRLQLPSATALRPTGLASRDGPTFRQAASQLPKQRVRNNACAAGPSHGLGTQNDPHRLAHAGAAARVPIPPAPGWEAACAPNRG